MKKMGRVESKSQFETTNPQPNPNEAIIPGLLHSCEFEIKHTAHTYSRGSSRRGKGSGVCGVSVSVGQSAGDIYEIM